ncbi:MAG: hypothetical protein J6Z49_06760 [Kiritimatiellae bacterium]|nr:hypothetical protein [Kiritimatiellia bacterium]
MGNENRLRPMAVESHRTPSKISNASSAAFSIFELVTVLAIIGVALLVSVGAFGPWGAYWKAKGARRAVCNALRETRSVALAQNRYAAFCYGNVATNEPVEKFAYTAYVFTNEAVDLEAKYKGVENPPGFEDGYQDAPWRFLPDGVTVAHFVNGEPVPAQECLILFRPDGTALSPYSADYATASNRTHTIGFRTRTRFQTQNKQTEPIYLPVVIDLDTGRVRTD